MDRRFSLGRWWALTALGLLVAAAFVGWSLSAIPGPWRWGLLPFLSVAMVASTFAAWPTVIGLAGRIGLRGPQLAPPRRDPASRTAVLVPIYDEDPAEVFARVRIMRAAVDASGLAGVGFFVLSDTRDPSVAVAEQREFDLLPAAGTPVTYRRRPENTGRKAGNIMAFCERWGGSFDHMLVLDADSLMGASAIARLIGLIDANPRAGLIQSMPFAVNRETLHARISQFAIRLYAPVSTEGAVVWHGPDGNYWGHNAIIRIAAFMAHARLPVLRGRPPLGGEILCHDVVEGALLRAAGWETWLVTGIEDTFEEMPPNMADDAVRERRWCQGNLQHMALLGRRGLRAPGRLHLGVGAIAYLAAPCWVVLMGTLAVMPERVAVAAAPALCLPILMLMIVPRALGALPMVVDARAAAGFGGRSALLASIAADVAVGLLATPGVMLSATRYVATTLTGTVVRWDAAGREARRVGWTEATRRFGWQAAAGLAWGAAIALRAPGVLPWVAPMVVGLLSAVPMAVFGSRVDLGRAARRWGLFLTEDELHPSPTLRAYRAARPAAALGEAD